MRPHGHGVMKPGGLGWSLIMFVVMFVVLTAGGIAYTERTTSEAQRRSDRRWCSLLQTLDDPSSVPTTERGRRIQAQTRQLRLEFHCK